MTAGIYSIQNTVNGKRYVGSSVNIEARWKQHINDLSKCKHHSVRLTRAWNIDGGDAFVFTILEVCAREDLLTREQRHIDLHKSANKHHGYNVCAVAKSRLGVKVSDESLRRMREAQQKRPPATQETRERMSKSARKPKSEAARKAMSAGVAKRPPITEETRKKMAASSSARRQTNESNALRSAALKGKPKSPETIAKMRASRQAGIARRKAMLSPQSDCDTNNVETT